MKIKINSNSIWANIFFNQLTALGIKYACISPGSRSTPLTYSLAVNKKIKCFVNLDERSSAFFSLGLAKASGIPSIIITTSGTAAAELYPAVIEAYYQRIPLIICTADRPPEVIGTGANQTINQYNLYRNHIRWFRDVGLPSVKENTLHYLQEVALKAFKISINDKGPVHINFPFAKPLEPFSYDNEMDDKILKMQPITDVEKRSSFNRMEKDRRIRRISEAIMRYEKGLIIAGPMEYDADVIKLIKVLSKISKYPILADGVSHFRFKVSKSTKHIISYYHSFLSSSNFIKKHRPELILHFGGTPTSTNLLNYLDCCDSERYQVNEFGDLNDPSRKTKMVLDYPAVPLTGKLIALFSKENFLRKKSTWCTSFVKADKISGKITNDLFPGNNKLNEPEIILELIKLLPSKTNLFIGNSLPIRDFDCFSGTTFKSFNLFFNRGASGIDGVVSTAFGVAAVNKPTVLLVGDLSFLYDLNSLLIAKKNSIPIIVIVINNNGGGIFQALPISKRSKLLKDYFIAPHNSNLAKVIEAFGINYKLISNKNDLKRSLTQLNIKMPAVLEIQTNAKESEKLRKKILDEVKAKIEKQLT